MAKKWKCVFFKAVNGNNTGVYTRTGQSRSFPTPGILFMRNCINGNTFYCDYTAGNPAGKNKYWKLLEPEKYSLTNYSKSKHPEVWMFIDSKYISMTAVDDDADKPKPKPVKVQPSSTKKDYSIKGVSVKDSSLTIKSTNKAKIPAKGEDTVKSLQGWGK